MKKLWICGQLKGKWDMKGSKWEFQGVFDSKPKAARACRDCNYFIFSAELNEELPHESVLPIGASYPCTE